MRDGLDKVALLCPGQGSQHVGMGQALAAAFPTARRAFEEASEALGYDVARLCAEGPAEALDQTERSQPALLTCSVASWRVLSEELGLSPAAGAGHSLGELSALACAGVLSLSEAAPLVAARGRAMQQAAPPGSGRMAAVFGLPVDQVEAACAASSRPGEPACVATNNSAEQTVISGAAAAVERAGQELTRRGGVVHPLKISIPAHSPLMAPAARALEEALDRVTVREAAWPVLANATNEPCREPAAIRSSLIQQLTRPVRWRQAMETLVQSGVQWVLEAGPRTVLRDLFKLEHPRVVAFSAGDPEGVKAVQAFLRARVSAGGEPQRVRFLARCLAIAAATRNTSTDPQRYALTVVEPHRKLREIRRVAGESGTADDAALREAAELLRRILRGKGVPEPERRASLDALRTETCTQALLPDLEP